MSAYQSTRTINHILWRVFQRRWWMRTMWVIVLSVFAKSNFSFRVNYCAWCTCHEQGKAMNDCKNTLKQKIETMKFPEETDWHLFGIRLFCFAWRISEILLTMSFLVEDRIIYSLEVLIFHLQGINNNMHLHVLKTRYTFAYFAEDSEFDPITFLVRLRVSIQIFFDPRLYLNERVCYQQIREKIWHNIFNVKSRALL